MIIHKQNNLAEILFVIYFWGFTILRPIVQIYSERSTTILFLFAIIIIAPLVLYKILTRSIIFDFSLFTLFGIFFLFLLDVLVRPNSLSYLYVVHPIIMTPRPEVLWCDILPFHNQQIVQKLIFEEVVHVFSSFFAPG